MKRIIIKSFISGLSILGLATSAHAGLLSGIPEEKQKKPLNVRIIQGNPSTKYSVVETIITSNPAKAGDPKKLIQRSELGTIGPEGKVINRNLPLRVPQLGFDIKSNLTDLVPEVVGAVSPNPKVQVAAAAAGSLVEEGLAFLSKELNKGYGNQQKEIRLLELIPSQYYAIDSTNNTVVVKDNFKTDLPLYLQAQANIVPIANELNKAKVEYNKMYQTWQELQKQKKFDEADAYVNKMENYRNGTVVPIEKRFITAAQAVEKYSMHRILIMNDPEGSDSSCQGGLQGRWNLLLYFYLGAKQTNRIKVSFCVPNTEKDQGLIVDLKKNQLVTDKNGEFRLEDGGIAFKSTDDKNITFPADIEAGRVAWDAPQSERINWFREMVTGEGSDLNALMFPFDLLKIAKDMKAQEDEEGKKRWEKTRAAIKNLKEQGGLPKKEASALDDLAATAPAGGAKPGDEQGNPPAGGEPAAGQKPGEAAGEKPKEEPKSILDTLGGLAGKVIEKAPAIISTGKEIFGAGKDVISAIQDKNKKDNEKKDDKPSAKDETSQTTQNYYAILGVPQKATQEEIKDAYKKLALTEHPDKGGDTEKFQKIVAAYETLKDPEKRAKYDESLTEDRP